MKQTFNIDLTVTFEAEKPISEDEARKKIGALVQTGTELEVNMCQNPQRIDIER